MASPRRSLRIPRASSSSPARAGWARPRWRARAQWRWRVSAKACFWSRPTRPQMWRRCSGRSSATRSLRSRVSRGWLRSRSIRRPRPRHTGRRSSARCEACFRTRRSPRSPSNSPGRAPRRWPRSTNSPTSSPTTHSPGRMTTSFSTPPRPGIRSGCCSCRASGRASWTPVRVTPPVWAPWRAWTRRVARMPQPWRGWPIRP